MKILQICPPHLSDVATLPWEIKQTFFNIIIHILQKKTNSNCCTAAVAVYLLLLSASYYLHSPSTASGARYTGAAINSAHVAKHGLNFSTSWCTMRLISVEKDWKHVFMQKAVTLNTCCDIACLTFQLPHITTGSFQSY